MSGSCQYVLGYGFEVGGHAVTNMLAGNSWSFSCGVPYIANLASAFELGALILKSFSDVLVIAVAELSLLDANYVSVCDSGRISLY
jgi:hypothetical protein